MIGVVLMALGLEMAQGQSLPQLSMPSGLTVTPLDQIDKADGIWRFQFLAPGISGAGAISLESALSDIAVLCRDHVLPSLRNDPAKPDQVVISLSDRPVVFGKADPEATQYFEAFDVSGDTCDWSFY